jgi:anti-sigma-K factor RskA
MRGYLAAACVLALAACDSTTAPVNQMTPTDTTTTVTGLVYSGAFHPVVHNGAGTAEVYRLESGSLELRFGTDFATADGPKLEVWLVKADDAPDSETVLATDYVSLGELESAAGAQTYEIPGGVDLDAYKSVVVWCVTFEVNFTAAPLMME